MAAISGKRATDERVTCLRIFADASTTLADLFTPLLRVDPGSAVRTSPRA